MIIPHLKEDFIMHIKLKNHHLIPLVPFLKDMKLKGEKSRARSKFLNIAMEAYAALHESEVDLLKDYAVLGEDGEPLTDAEGGFTLREDAAKEYLAEREKLFFEEAEIEGGTYSEHLSMMRQILSDYDEDLDGENAALYDALCDAFDAETVEESETNA
jgi:hypothetical protein